MSGFKVTAVFYETEGSPVITLLLAFAAMATAPTPTPVADYVKPPTVESMKMSPDGRYLAMVAPQSDYETQLVVLDTKTLKSVGGLKSAKQRLVGDYWWASDERLVVAVARKFGGLDEPLMTGHLFAVDADGSDIVPLYGAGGGTSVGTRMQQGKVENGVAEMVDMLRDDPDHAVIAIWTPGSELPYTELYTVDVNNGRREKITRAPIARGSFLLDPDGRVRYAWGTNATGWHELHAYGEDHQWSLVNDEEKSGVQLTPLAIGSDGVYMQVLGVKGPGRIVMWDPDKGEGKLVFKPRVAQPAGILVAADGRSVYGVITAEDRDDIQIVDAKSPQARSLSAIARNFKDAFVAPLSWTRDGKLALIAVTSDRNSGEYYLFDRTSGKAQFLLARDEWLDPAAMQARTPVEIAARDKTPLHGYLTLPAADAKNVPMVLVVHGGPHGVRDNWLWEPWSQLLASRGYAVLQVNFRGSGDYGQAFETSGYRQWGGTMADDLTDATRWAIAQGHADPKRICIMGASFGGYAALMGAVREPDLYQCAISYAGLSDLNLMHTRGDIADSRYGRRYLELAIGKDSAELNRFSPAHHADRIKAAVMLIHGDEDERVPIAHANAMRKALEKQGKTVEWLVEDDEAHGFYRQDHRLAVYERVLRFLGEHTAP
jgi:dipeptidyl aminopeptidase/acylaminoacyl peptidase